MKFNLLILLFLITFFGCKKVKNYHTKKSSVENISSDTVHKAQNSISISTMKDSLLGTQDFQKLLSSSVKIQNHGNKHKDWMSNKVGFTDRLLGIDKNDIIIETTSYTYEEDVIFYIHSLKHVKDSISLRPFIESIRGKSTEGYTQVRVLIFAMRNNKECNFIDIPPNYGYSKLRNELIEKVYKKIDFPVVSCDTTEICRMRNLGK